MASASFLPALSYGGSESEEEEDRGEGKVVETVGSSRTVDADTKDAAAFVVEDEVEDEKRTREEVVREALEARKGAVFGAVWRLSSETVTREELEALPLTSKEFVDLCEERCVSELKLCALPTCGNRNKTSNTHDETGSVGTRRYNTKYDISLREKRVYFLDVTSKFCSRACAVAAEDYARGLGSTIDFDEKTGACFVPRAAPAAIPSSTDGKEAPSAPAVNIPTHAAKGSPGYRIEANGVVSKAAAQQRGKGRAVVVERQVKEKKKKKRVSFQDPKPSGRRPVESQVVERRGKSSFPLRKKSGGGEESRVVAPGGAESKAVQAPPGGGEATQPRGSAPPPPSLTSGDQPVIYFEIENQKAKGKDGEEGIQVGRLKVMNGGGSEGTQGEAGGHHVDAEMGEAGYGGAALEGEEALIPEGGAPILQVPHNLASLIPSSSLNERQEALRKAILESNQFEEEFCDAEMGGEDEMLYTSDEEADGNNQLDNYKLTFVSSFCTVYNFLNTVITEKVLKFLDQAYMGLSEGGGGGKGEADGEHDQRAKLFAEQLSRVLPYVYQEMNISARSHARFGDLELDLMRAIQCLRFDSPVTSLSFDEWCIVGLSLLRALVENRVVELRGNLTSGKDKINEFLVKCGTTKREFDMIMTELFLVRDPAEG
ncbi:RTR1-type domain-containing protein [Chloropicon primus]|uniref:RNA polymerase II subunit B1 CTD phosphatase RPAP2 homolog n=1 Tax=Chloropicon primus TaxID=1764295 RepID=A0A5B8MQZ1_9CHLO|nr:hypothetical protein A3770_09p56560 [Chloropicon primus]UPR02352.1 RTR1-type domain-containing protein [Chloropicon primus]|eukprot:QDZ23138.1 hypothetical protein A3770_09p56560 [Chloropicon primus]